MFAVHATDFDDGRHWPAVANLGERPTVGGRKLLLEVHALDASPDLYGHHLGVDFLKRLRTERRFDSLDELKAQIARDADDARDVFASAVSASETGADDGIATRRESTGTSPG